MKNFSFLFVLSLLVSSLCFTACSEDSDPNTDPDPDPIVTNVLTATLTDQSGTASDWVATGIAATVTGNAIQILAETADGSLLDIEFNADAAGIFAFNTGASAVFTEDTETSNANGNRTFGSKEGTGSIIITEFNTTDKSLTGTFSLDVIHGLSGTTYYLTDGVITNVSYTE